MQPLSELQQILQLLNIQLIPSFNRCLFSHFSLFAGIKLTLSALLDGKNVNAGGRKLGLGLEFEA